MRGSREERWRALELAVLAWRYWGRVQQDHRAYWWETYIEATAAYGLAERLALGLVGETYREVIDLIQRDQSRSERGAA